MRFALCLLAFIVPGVAQLQSVEIRVSGLDCSSCAESVDRKLSRIRGVESARFDAAKNTATLKLRTDNTITLAAIRDALKSIGYTPEEANIVVRGDLRDGVLSLKHQGRAFVVEGAKETGSVSIEGTVPAGTDELRPRYIRPQ
jgi:copper chaperone CopZ